ncbi:MAG TPA: hypothetical protein VEQ60_27225 [Longimicrobium sp.]|nr:hypothetical protein [Longimicrobium sp.]
MPGAGPEPSRFPRHAGETMKVRALLRMLAFAALLTLPGCLVVTCGP